MSSRAKVRDAERAAAIAAVTQTVTAFKTTAHAARVKLDALTLDLKRKLVELKAAAEASIAALDEKRNAAIDAIRAADELDEGFEDANDAMGSCVITAAILDEVDDPLQDWEDALAAFGEALADLGEAEIE